MFSTLMVESSGQFCFSCSAANPERRREEKAAQMQLQTEANAARRLTRTHSLSCWMDLHVIPTFALEVVLLPAVLVTQNPPGCFDLHKLLRRGAHGRRLLQSKAVWVVLWVRSARRATRMKTQDTIHQRQSHTFFKGDKMPDSSTGSSSGSLEASAEQEFWLDRGVVPAGPAAGICV